MDFPAFRSRANAIFHLRDWKG